MKPANSQVLSRIALLALTVVVLAAQVMAAEVEPRQVPAPGAAAAAPTLRSMRVANDRQSVAFTLDIAGDFEYAPSAAAAGSRLLLVDLPGVLFAEPSSNQTLDSPVVANYRLVNFLRDGKPSVRLEVNLKTGVAVNYHKTGSGLEVRVSPAEVLAPAPAAILPAAAAASLKPATASAPPVSTTAKPATRLEKILVRNSGDAATVEIAANGSVDYKSFELTAPRRLVVDIANVVNISGRTFGRAEGLVDLRAGQFVKKPPVTRVVLEFDNSVRYEIRRTAAGLAVEWSTRTAAAPARRIPELVAVAVPVPALSPAASMPAPSIRPSVTMPNAFEDIMAGMRQLYAAPKVELVEASGGPWPGGAAPAPAVEPQVAQSRPLALIQPRMAAPMETALAAPPPVQQAAPQQAQARPAPPAAASGAQGKRYTGEPISINIKDLDLKDFFRLIHEISGLNVVLDKEVRGLLSMVLDEVPWDQALDIVLRNFQLDSVLEGNVLRIVTLDTLKREQKDVADLAKAQRDTVERITVTRSVNYAKALDLVPTIRKFLSDRAEVIADERTNQLIIVDIPQTIPTMDEVMKQLDRKTQQVEIEARVVAASREFVRELGSQFGFAVVNQGLSNLIGGNPVGSSSSPITGRPIAPPFSQGGQAIPLISNFPAAGANSGFTYSHSSNNFALDAILTAAERRGIGKVISRPRIVTQNNRKGTVQQGAKIPVQTTVNNTVSVNFVDVTLSMNVTPQITSEDTIFLEIDVTNASIDPGIARINGIPALATQQASTRVLVKDGGTVVFGGVISNENNLTIQQVPLLGSVPIIGHLFKRTGVSTRTNELLFFVTPKIV